MAETIREILLWSSAIATAGFGVALIAAPGPMSELYGGEPSPAVEALARVFGAVTLAFTLLAVLGRGLRDLDARRAVDATFLTAWALVGVASVWNAAVLGGGNALVVWATIALYAALALGFAYLLAGPDVRGGPRAARATPK